MSTALIPVWPEPGIPGASVTTTDIRNTMPTSTITLLILTFLLLLPGGLPAAEPASPPVVEYGDPEREPQPEGWPLTIPAEWEYVNKRFKERCNISTPGRYQAANIDPSTGTILPSSWMKQHETLVERLDSLTTSPDIVLIGDSITQNWGNTALMGKSLAATRPVAAWQDYFPNYIFYNAGQAGGGQSTVLWRLKHGGLKGSHRKAQMNPKLAILNIGVNPLIGSDNYPEMALGIRRIVEEIRKQLPVCRILVLGVFPTARKAERIAPLNAAVATELKPLTEDPRSLVSYLDIGKQFLESDGVTLMEQYFHDRLHPNDDGYALICQAIQPKVDQLLRDAYDGQPFPVITAPETIHGPRNKSLALTFSIHDEAPSPLHFSAVCDRPDLFPAENLVFKTQGETLILTLTPQKDQGGSARVRIDVSKKSGQTSRKEIVVHIGDSLTPLAIYDEGYQNGWNSKGPLSSEKSEVHTGKYALKMTDSNFRIDAEKGRGVDITNYQSITLWLHGGMTGGQRLNLYLCQFKGPFSVLTLPELKKNAYLKVTISLDDFRHRSGTELNGLMFKGPSQTEIYIDDITLDPCHPADIDLNSETKNK